MKRLPGVFFYTVILAILLALGVSAQSTCGDANDIILKLSSGTNSHGQTWNQNGYNYQVCFSDLFGSAYSGANPHQCIGSGASPDNLVLRLSSNTNAQAQGPDYTGTAYTTDVCYGDLSCYSTSNSCASGELEVVSLSANNNAHLETSSSNNYNLKICCATNTATSPRLFNPIWKYYDESQINTGSLICSGSYLVASVGTSGLADGEGVSFKIYDNDNLGSDEIINFVGTVSGNKAKAILNLTDPEIRDTLNSFIGGLEGNELELFFTVNKSNVQGIQTSNQVIYTDNRSLCSYNKPIGGINAPIRREVYFKGTVVEFDSECSSQIGPLRYGWSVIQNGETQNRFEKNFTMSFANSGQVNVRLKCSDVNEGFSFDESQILIIDSSSVLAYINEPSLDSFVYSSPPISGPYFPQTVSFSSSDSFALNVVNSCNDIQCIAGDCPSQTQNSPSTCGTYGAPVTINSTGTPNYNSLDFNWRFWDNNWNEEWSSYEGPGVYRGAVIYDDVSNSLNDKHMSVSVSHSSGATANFQRDFTLGRCLNNGNNYYSSTYESLQTSLENNACTGGDTLPETADDCCPSGFQCSNDGSSTGQYYCKLLDNPNVRCEDFDNETSCNSNNNPSIPSASYGGDPPLCTFLKCYWSSNSNSCGVRATSYGQNSTGCNVGGGTQPGSDCAWTTSQTECVNGKRTISYNTILGPASCNKEPLSVPCGSLSFELGFFGFREFALSLFIIAGIYIFIGLFKKNEKK